jgi:rubrerythrin
MDLESILNRCHRLEQRAASLYRSFAARSRANPAICTLWTGLAREEEEHARSISEARAHLRPRTKEQGSIDGWDTALAEVEHRLDLCERLGADTPLAQQLSGALELELTALEAARQAVLAAARAPDPDRQHEHAEHLAAAAVRLTDDPQVRLQVALLRARARLQPL